MKIEIAVFDIEGAKIAQNAGAHRIEFCSSINEGGVSPSYGTIMWAKENLNLPVFVMIRPRGGNFVYSKDEISIMKKDVEFCKSIGVDGVVFGILEKDNNVDIPNCKQIIKCAGDMQLTFHRAFDRAANPKKALEEIIDLGFHRILTSGQKNTAPEGVELISDLVKIAGNRIIILPGSGVDESNLKDLHANCNAKEYHSSAKILVNSNKNSIPLSNNLDSLNVWSVSDLKVRKMISIAENYD